MVNFLKNYTSTLIFIWIFYLFYSQNGYYSNFLQWNYSFIFYPWMSISYKEIIQYLLLTYIFLLIPFYIFSTSHSKARIVFWYFKNKIFLPKYSISQKEKTAILAWIVKWFFAPLMILWVSSHIMNLWNQWFLVWEYWSLKDENFLEFFNQYFFVFAFSFILFIDVFFFTLGYLLEWKFFKNEIKSVEPTLFWWLVCLICYPPFNWVMNQFVWWYSSDFPKFWDFYVHIWANIILLIAMCVYSRASLALWLKASNLTNRGIVTTWPYKFIRHPAYIMKNFAWWIGGSPILFQSFFSWNFKVFFMAFLSLSVWTLIYYFRAITEEKHLSQDVDYINYTKKVPYRFIPWWK